MEYWNCVDILEAREELRLLQIHNFNNYSKSDRKQIRESLEKRSTLGCKSALQINSFKEMASKMIGMNA